MSNFSAYVISLEHALQRRKAVSRRLDKLEINYRFLDATRGSDINRRWIELNLTPDFMAEHLKYKQSFITKNALACSDSHRRVWSEICSSTEIEFSGISSPVMILEDDAALFNNRIVYERIATAFQSSSYEMLLLFYSTRPQTVLRKHAMTKIGFEHYIADYPDKPLGGSVAYLLKRSGAKKMLSSQDPRLTRMADSWDFEVTGVRAGIVFPIVVGTGEFDSTIGYGVSSWQFKKTFLKMIAMLPVIRSLIWHFYRLRSRKRITLLD